MKKWIQLVTVSSLALGILAGCGNEVKKEDASVTSNEQTKKTFTFGDTTFNAENAEADINPHREYSGWAAVRYGVGETLFRYSEEMQREPWLAKDAESLDDLTWKITLQENVTFTSGRKMDGEAVKETLEALVKNHERAAGDLKIDSISSEGQTITIKTKEPVPTLLNYLSDPYGAIFDVQAGVSPEGIVQATGPYKAVSLESGERLELVKNEDYWDGEPKIDEITVLTISDGDTLTLALQSGEIDAAYGMPYASYPLFENDDYEFTSNATSRAFFAWMNFKSKITQDPAVRKALAMGIHKEGFVNTLLNGNGYPANGVFPDTFSFGNDTVTTESYDPEGAKKVLEENGWIEKDDSGIREKDGEKLVIRWLTYPSRQELPLLAESAQATLKDVGIDVQINSTADHNSIVEDSAAWDVYASAMVTAPTGDPEYFFTTTALDESSFNVGHYHSDRLEELANDMSKTFDPEKRAKIAVDMQQTILDDNAYIFASHLRMSMISKKNVKGLKAHPTDFYEITVDLDVE